MNFLACDLGGTKVLLGMFKKEINDESPNLIIKKKYISSEWVSFELILEDFLKNGFIAIGAMHLTGIFYNFIQIIFYSQFNIFLYNLGKYSVGKIGYHFLTLFPLLLLIKPIKSLKHSK